MGVALVLIGLAIGTAGMHFIRISELKKNSGNLLEGWISHTFKVWLGTNNSHKHPSKTITLAVCRLFHPIFW